MAPLSSYLVLLAAGAGLVASVEQSSQCYFPDGSSSPTDFVCNSTTGDGFSSCCGHQVDGSAAYCMSNGLCLSDMFLSRGSCTDKSWKSKNCAQVCTSTSTNGGVGIRPCGYTGQWDCGDGSGCSKNAISISTGSFELTNQQLAAMGAVPASSSPSSSSSSSSTAAATATASAMPSMGNSSTSESGLNDAQATGLAVGLPLGLLTCLFLTLWLFERRKASQTKRQLQMASFGGWNDEYDRSSKAVSQHQPNQQQHAREPSGNALPLGHAKAIQRMASSGAGSSNSVGSQLGVHPAYRRGPDGYFVEQKDSPPPPPPPPKMYEAPAGGQRSSFHVQELPAGH